MFVAMDLPCVASRNAAPALSPRVLVELDVAEGYCISMICGAGISVWPFKNVKIAHVCIMGVVFGTYRRKEVSNFVDQLALSIANQGDYHFCCRDGFGFV